MEQTNEHYWKNKVVVVTGGTSGLGQALAINLYSKGSKVAIIARSNEKLKEMEADFPGLLTISADVGDPESVYKISGIVQGTFGTIDVLFNNASMLGPTPLKLLLDTECEDLSRVLETNVIGPFRLIKAFLPTMILNKSGLVVNISSDASISAYETWGSYSLSKAALDHLSRIWAEEIKGSSVKIYALDPGDMYTPMHIAAIPNAKKSDLSMPTDVANDMLSFLSMQLLTSNQQVRFSSSEWRNLI